MSGTSPTFNAALQTSDDGTTFMPLNKNIDPAAADARTQVAFAQLTGPGSEALRVNNPLGRYIRVAVTIGGTTSNVAATIDYVLKS